MRNLSLQGVACNFSRKLIVPIEDRTFEFLDQESIKHGLSIEELFRVVVIPEWLGTKSGSLSGAFSNQRNTLSVKLATLERALKALKGEIEVLVVCKEHDQGGSAKLVRSIEDLLVRTFGKITATNLLYEIGKEAGKHSVGKVAKETSRSSSIQRFRQVCDANATFWGWKRLETRELDPAKALVHSRGIGSAYARNRTGKTPTCHFGRGVVAGALEAFLKTNCESIETGCEGKGDEYCELVSGAADEIARIAEISSVPVSNADTNRDVTSR